MRHLGRHGHVGGAANSPREGPSEGTWLSIHYMFFIGAMFLAIASLNVLDLWTSGIALSKGFLEGNGLVLALANILGLRTIDGLLLTKSAGIVGGLVATLMGIRIQNRQVRKTAIIVMAFLVMFLLAVSINNLYVISI